MDEELQNHRVFWLAISGLSVIPILLIIFLADPHKAPWFLFVILYLFLFALLFGLLTVLLGLAHRHPGKAALRESFFLTLFATVSLYLSSQNLLTWWITIIFLAALFLIEMFFLM